MISARPLMGSPLDIGQACEIEVSKPPRLSVQGTLSICLLRLPYPPLLDDTFLLARGE